MKKKHIFLLVAGVFLILCVLLILPLASRDLSEVELEIAEVIFGDSLDYSQVRVKEGGLLTWIYPGVTLCNTIAFPVGSYDEHDLHDQALFLHELTHVWQCQNHGLSYIPRALYEEIFTDAYVVYFDEKKSFADYDVEEQGEIVAEYHLTGEPLYEGYILEIKGE